MDVEIHYLGGRARDLLLDEYIKTKFKAKSKDDKEADVEYRPYNLKVKVMNGYVKSPFLNDIDEVDIDDYDRIFDTYFKPSLKAIFGDGDKSSKNLEKTSE